MEPTVAASNRRAPDLRSCWSGCRDSNPGPSVPQTDALTKLRHSPLRHPSGPRRRCYRSTAGSAGCSRMRRAAGARARRATRCPGRRGTRGRRRPRRPAASGATGSAASSSSSSGGGAGACRTARTPRVRAPPGSTARPHAGHVPSVRTVDGERKRSHVSHQGTPPFQHRGPPTRASAADGRRRAIRGSARPAPGPGYSTRRTGSPSMRGGPGRGVRHARLRREVEVHPDPAAVGVAEVAV